MKPSDIRAEDRSKVILISPTAVFVDGKTYTTITEALAAIRRDDMDALYRLADEAEVATGLKRE